MKGKYRRRAKRQSLTGLDKDLEALLSKEKKNLAGIESRNILKNKELAFIIILIVLTSALILAFYYVTWRSDSLEKPSPSQELSSVSSEQSGLLDTDSDYEVLTPEQIRLKKKLVIANAGEFKSRWNLTNFQRLQTADPAVPSPGATLDQVFEEFGQGSDVTFSGDSLYLDYDGLVYDYAKYGVHGLQQSIHLSFTKKGSDYYLTSKEAIYLTDEQYAPAVEGRFSFKWKAEDMDSLLVGDASSGQGGMTYQEVVERFGQPKTTNLSSILNSPMKLRVSYTDFQSQERKQSFVDLTFVQQEDQSFRLAVAQSEFDQSY